MCALAVFLVDAPLRSTPSLRGAGAVSVAESLYPQNHGWAPLFSLRSDRFKFIDAPRPELYDLRLDPFEERNIFEQRQGLAAALQSRLRMLMQPEPSTGARARWMTNWMRAWRRWGTSSPARLRCGPGTRTCRIRKSAPAYSRRAAASECVQRGPGHGQRFSKSNGGGRGFRPCIFGGWDAEGAPFAGTRDLATSKGELPARNLS